MVCLVQRRGYELSFGLLANLMKGGRWVKLAASSAQDIRVPP
jgi:hypothetical protein